MKKSALLAAFLLLLIHSLFAMDQPLNYRLIKPALKPELIPLISIDEILSHIHTGTKVVFIDARELEEYQEDHIPGALNLTLRQVKQMSAKQFIKADLVITYCLKDFRGYELGRALKMAGLNNIRIMQDPGINGWKQQGLPYASRDGLTDVKALARLSQCAANRNHCQQNGLTQVVSYASTIPAS
jgi:rhodanese-related sulfurtransferase